MPTRGVTLPRNRRLPSPGFAGSVPLSMPLGLIVGRTFKPFSRAISSRCSEAVFSSAATLLNSSSSRDSSSARLSPERLGGSGTFARNRTESSRSKRKMQACPHFCPSYKNRRRKTGLAGHEPLQKLAGVRIAERNGLQIPL
jgi:hypothetical protein